MSNILDSLLESYQSKLKSINELIESKEMQRIVNRSEITRLEIKRNEYKSFISDIEKEMKYTERNLINALHSYINENGYKNENGVLLPQMEQHIRIQKMMDIKHELLF